MGVTVKFWKFYVKKSIFLIKKSQKVIVFLYMVQVCNTKYIRIFTVFPFIFDIQIWLYQPME